MPTQIRGLLAISKEGVLALPSVRLLVTSGSATAPHERAQIMSRLTPGFFDLRTSEGGGISVLMPDEQIDFADTVGCPAFRVEIGSSTRTDNRGRRAKWVACAIADLAYRD